MVDHLVTFHALALLWAKRRNVPDGRRLPWDRTTPQSSVKIFANRHASTRRVVFTEDVAKIAVSKFDML
jgi:hypothetical protein